MRIARNIAAIILVLTFVVFRTPTTRAEALSCSSSSHYLFCESDPMLVMPEDYYCSDICAYAGSYYGYDTCESYCVANVSTGVQSWDYGGEYQCDPGDCCWTGVCLDFVVYCECIPEM